MEILEALDKLNEELRISAEIAKQTTQLWQQILTKPVDDHDCQAMFGDDGCDGEGHQWI